ncbi:MAG: hypothetical protein WAO69_00145 [Aestuariivita sp.]|uniref:hypothetical protein n=1 Tax=Aestuariivita sp. TaxID=1872407 RepID=UPI003BAEE4EC
MIKTVIAAKPIVALTLTVFLLAGCSTRLNPFNWFGGSEEVIDVGTGEINPLLPQDSGGGMFDRPEDVYPGVPIDQITELRIDRTRSGAIILVQGLASRQGPYEVQLTPANPDNEPVDGVLTYTFEIIYPSFNTPVGPEATRRVTAASAISNEQLAGLSRVRVVGARNALETSRR